MKEIEAIVTNEFVKQIIEDSRNPLTIQGLAKAIRIKTNGEFIRRKIIEHLGRIEKSGLFHQKKCMINPDQYQYGEGVFLTQQELS